jgi:hypothetical protein
MRFPIALPLLFLLTCCTGALYDQADYVEEKVSILEAVEDGQVDRYCNEMTEAERALMLERIELATGWRVKFNCDYRTEPLVTKVR